MTDLATSRNEVERRQPTPEDFDQLELAMLAAAPVQDCPLEHRFTPGLYAREIFIPAGTLTTSKIHKTEHPYVVLTGRVSVYIPGTGIEEIEAPHVGITKPGTRRLIYVHEDCRWITFHVNPSDTEDLDEIEERIIERRGRTAHELYREMLRQLPGQGEYGGAP